MACRECAEDVLAIISEDPPIFSSVWPRIQSEKYMQRNFRVAIEVLGKPGKRDFDDIEQYLSQMGMPEEGKSELLIILPYREGHLLHISD